MDAVIKERKISEALVACVMILTAAVCLHLTSGTAKADTFEYKITAKTKTGVYAKAHSSSKKIGVVKKGTRISSDKIVNGKWYRFKYKGTKAFIRKKSVKRRMIIRRYVPKRKGRALEVLNIRKGHSINSAKVGLMDKGTRFWICAVYFISEKDRWYKIKYRKGRPFVNAGYVKAYKVKNTKKNNKDSDKIERDPKKETSSEKKNQEDNNNSSGRDNNRDKGKEIEDSDGRPAADPDSDSDYSSQLTKEGFPESYQSGLKALHDKHPDWVFKAKKVKYSWKTLNKKASHPGTNCIDSTVTKSWRSKSSDVYDKRTGQWTAFDGGRWYQAKSSVLAYYLDPRNFLNSRDIYQFLTHKYVKGSQSKKTVKKLVSYVSYSFLNTKSYIDILYKAGKNAKVNSNVLAATVIEEQGWYGSSDLISGQYPGYSGYYNYFNIGAYTGDGMNKIERGLWYAKGAGTGATTYGRPWNSRYKALAGGAVFYSDTYIKEKQYNYYSKKFNVFNGAASVGEHEYSTNVLSPLEEGELLKLAYRGSENRKLKFVIPVYKDMPEEPCPKPKE